MTCRHNSDFPEHCPECKREAIQWSVQAEINPDHSMSWEDCMRKDIAELVTCSAIYLLPGWHNSKGATLEHHIAERLGLHIIIAPQAVEHVSEVMA